MRRRIGTLLTVMVLATTMLCGCQSKSGAGNGEVKIFYSGLESGDYHANLANMSKSKADELGVQMDIEYAENSIELQDEQIKKAVDGKYDVIICSLVTPDTAGELKAVAGDIPIVFINSAPDESVLEKNQIVYVASDEIVAGQYQAEYILEKFADKDEINVVMFKGPQGHSATEGRTGGVKKTLEASGKKINYVFDDYAGFNPTTAEEMMGVFLKTKVPFDCIIANNDDMANGAVAACESANADLSSVTVAGIDASANGCEAIKNGKMAFTVYQSTKGQCEMAVEAAVKLAKGESIQELNGATEDGKYVWIPFEKVDSSNVEQYSAK